MKLLYPLAALTLTASTLTAQADYNPVARPEAMVTCGNARFTVLTPRMLRIEYSETGRHEDRASFTVVNRDLPVPDYTVKGTDPRAASGNLTVTFDLNGQPVEWYPGKVDTQNLKGTYRTLDSCDGDNRRADMEPGLVSRSGWAIIDDSWQHQNADGSRTMLLEPSAEAGFDWVAQRDDRNAMDTYLLAYGHDYMQAIHDYTLIGGSIPLPPDYVFGYWYSKYHRYTQQDFQDIVDALVDNDIPADVMIVDNDWHTAVWSGWTWNNDLIPDPRGMIKYMNDKGFHVSLNIHPAFGVDSLEDGFNALRTDLGMADTTRVVPWTLENPKFYTAFFKNIIRPLEADGCDFWWLDWQQWTTCPRLDGLGETFWCNHVFYNDMKLKRPDRRPVIFHRWGGLGSHRYQIGFSGDAVTKFETLAFEPYFTATASNVGYGYWGHDLGGHLQHGPNDPELYLRWIQYGVFTPIFRTHSANFPNIERRIWKYPNFPLMRDAVRLRYSLFPYIYTMARDTYDTGISMTRPLYYYYPELEIAYTNENEFFFGDDILVAPIVEPADSVTGISAKTVWLPEGDWYSPAHNRVLTGGGNVGLTYTQAQIPYFLRRGAMIPCMPEGVRSVTQHPDTMVVNVVSAPQGAGRLYEDEGDNDNYKQSAYAWTRFTQSTDSKGAVYTVKPAEGSFDGMKTQRAYTFNVYDSQRPSAVTIDGKPLDYTYNDATRTLTFTTPMLPTATGVTVTARY